MSNDLSININNYVNNDYSICREERQYALYLSNVLRYYGNNTDLLERDEEVKIIFNACGFENDKLNNLVIDHVFYEATFMRDFFERNRRINLSDPNRKEDVCKQKSFTPSSYTLKDSDKEKSFNRKLLRFCWKKVKNKEIDFADVEIFEMNYGQNEIPDKYKQIANLARAMMNSKPDLAVIYHKNEKKYLLFLECKFDSGEDKINGYEQTEIQGYIAEFLCKNYLTELSISEIMGPENGKYCSKLVRFDRNKKTTENISISDLIKIEKRIFEKPVE